MQGMCQTASPIPSSKSSLSTLLHNPVTSHKGYSISMRMSSSRPFRSRKSSSPCSSNTFSCTLISSLSISRSSWQRQKKSGDPKISYVPRNPNLPIWCLSGKPESPQGQSGLCKQEQSSLSNEMLSYLQHLMQPQAHQFTSNVNSEVKFFCGSDESIDQL